MISSGMSMFSSADAYDRFMGRYSVQLSPQLADFAGVSYGQRVLDVGCGPGALIAELVARLGAESVAAIDPSEQFVGAAREHYPDVDVRLGPAEDLPFADGEFDAALAQLVVHFMSDPLQGLREMARVTRRGGVVAACVWDHANAPLSPFWDAARELDPHVRDESGLAGSQRGQLGELFRAAGMKHVEETELPVDVRHASFEEWWQPFTLGVGPSGVYLAGLDSEQRAELEARCRAAFPDGAVTMTARAWAARGAT
jgi:SAM-dependent methyltransferase